MPNITIFADYVCPYCLLVEHLLSRAIGGRNVTIHWRGYELRPAPVPTLRPEDPYLPNIWRSLVYPLAERLGIRIKLPTISPQPRTNKAFQLLALAQDRHQDHAYSLCVLRAFFQDNRDIGHTDIVLDLAAEAGLDAAEAHHALETGRYVERQALAQHYAQETLGITSVPTLIIGTQMLRGMPSPDVLAHAVDRLFSASTI